MVLKTEVCRFSGLKIYPGHGMRLTKMDSQTFLFLNAKCKRLFNLRLRPAKLAWTTQYRKAHKKVRVAPDVFHGRYIKLGVASPGRTRGRSRRDGGRSAARAKRRRFFRATRVFFPRTDR